MIAHRFWTIRSLSICLALACFSGLSAHAEPRMGLVAPGVGWAVLNQGTMINRNDHLFWTSDDGGAWRDITPRDPASREIAGVFFLDASRGWVLLALKRETPKNNQESDNFITDIRGFDLASTTDGGASWTIKHLDSLPEGVGWASAGEIFFLDAAHGWMDIESPVPHWGGEGVLLATTDGGNTWKGIEEVNGGGGYGPIRFIDPQNGWIAGGPGDNYLYATNDGGRHWREVPVPAPREISGLFENVGTLYASPAFTDSKHGFLSVKYFGPAKSGGDLTILVLFSTDDGGRTWRSESWVNLDQPENFPIFSVIDSTALAPRRLGHAPMTLVKLHPRGKVSETAATEAPELRNNVALLSLNFSDATHGWASSSDGLLLSTADGGLTWKDITPAHKKASTLAPSTNGVLGGSSSGTPLQNSAVSLAASATASSGPTTYKSRHLGFDLCQAPMSGPMGTWWTSSPYFDIGIYVGGSNRTCPQPNLISSWVKTVTGSTQGWGLIPIWVGPQAPCTCAPSTPAGIWPNCPKNWASTISTTGSAYAQGQAEADAATSGSRSAMQKLGLGSGSPVYFDIENYTPSATCDGNPTGSYVNAFLSGWVSKIHTNGYIAGVYGNPTPASDWYAGTTGYGPVSPSPDDVWITKYDNRVTIWGLVGAGGQTLTDAAWPQNQRMHQYFINLTNQTETWGGQALVIDKDIEDADVVGGNGTKTYSFSYTTIDYPGAPGTTLSGINNSGQITGYYLDPTGPDRGFLYANGSFTAINYPNATQTLSLGINNFGNIVGYYIDQLGGHGFLYQGGNYTSFDYPGATGTVAFGINDDNQISGYYTDSQSVQHGFLYQAGNFTPVDYPGALQTQADSINGDAQIAGCADASLAFLYAQGTFSNPPVNCAAGVNNNEQITGSLGSNNVFEHEGSYSTIAVPGASSTNVSFLNDFTLNTQNTAKVAVVGQYFAAGHGHGFLATSQ